jgi:urea transport system substrate-binding protein
MSESTVVCPNVDDYVPLLSGAASADAYRLTRHLLSCPACQDVVRELPGGEALVDRLRGDLVAADATTKLAPEMTTPGNAPHRAAAVIWTALLDPPEEPGEIGRIEAYRVRRVLGSGGMGTVFEAQDINLNRIVALKVPHPDGLENPTARERFVREARAAAALSDDHIVTVFHVGQAHDIPFLVMEYLHGESLDARLRREETIPVLEAVRIGWQVCQGLATAHEHGVIHRDIKPANIWIEERPTRRGRPQSAARIKLLDFGLARPAGPGQSLTAFGQVLGSPGYMSPEQARGQRVDARSDLFSLGTVLYRILSGAKPFVGPTSDTIRMAVIADDPERLEKVNPAVPADLADLVHRLMAKRPEDRPASAHEAADALRAIEERLQGSSATGGSSARWLPWVVGGVIAAALAAVAIALIAGK